MVAAAFIGPGTVTTATLAGGNFGFTLLWAVAFSVIATLVLQEMTCRLGVIGKLGLGDAIVQKTQKSGLYIRAALVICAIFIGNAPMKPATSQALPLDYPLSASWVSILGAIYWPIAFALLASEKFHLIERFWLAWSSAWRWCSPALPLWSHLLSSTSLKG